MTENVTENVIRFTVQGKADLDRIVEVLRSVEGELQGTGKATEQTFSGMVGAVRNARNEFNGLGKSVRDAGPGSTTTQWDTLRGRIQQATTAYREFNAQRALSGQGVASPSQFIAAGAGGTGVTTADLSAYKEVAGASLLDSEAQKAIQSLPRLRYALYDVATSATFTGIAMTGLSVAVGAVAVKMDRQFADVVRTTGTYMDASGTQTANLRKQFEALFASIPANWTDLTQIGSLAGQLGIAKNDVADFTKLVAQFSATTNVTVDAAATAFGRLAQLLDVPAAKYQNLGSAVLRVGVNSVATESQILSLTTQIAPMARTVGLTADQVVGLAGALASLGVQPELARGTTTRLFTDIQTAVSGGGAKLQAFARISGETVSQFTTQWGTDAAGALQKLFNGLGGLDQSQAIAALHEIGLTSARDVPTMLRLAQNTDLVARAFKDAKGGMESGQDVAQHYNVITSTMAEKLQVLANNFQLFIEHLGSSNTVLGGFVDLLIGVVGWLQKLIDNPISATIAGLLLAFTALGGVVLIVVGALARFAASMFAVRTAATELGIANNGAALSFRTLTAAITGAEAAAGTSSKAMTGLGFAVKGLGVATVAMIAIPILDQLHQWVLEADGATVSTDKLGKALGNISNGQDTAASIKAVEDQIRAIARASNDAIIGNNLNKVGDGRNAIANKVKADLQTAQQVLDQGFGILGKKTQDFGIFNGWLSPQLDRVKAGAQTFADAWNRASTATQQQSLLDYFDKLKAQAREAALKGGESARDFEEGWRTNMAPAIAAIGSGVDAQKLLAEQSKQTADDITNSISDITSSTEATLSAQKAIYDLGAALGENGAQWSQYSEAGRANMGALLGVVKAIAAETPGDSATIASNLQALFDQIVKGGYASAGQLTVLQQIIAGLSGGKAVQAASADFTSLFNGVQDGYQKAAAAAESSAKKQQAALKQTQKEVRTLVDYANDLSGVFTRAFDLRFGGQQGLDSIASGWQKIQQQIEDAKKSLDDLYAKQNQLSASKATKQYQLGIAQTYGDSVQAAQLQSDIGDINNQMADNQTAIVKAQQAMTLSLQGNSAAAIQNRSDILGLVQSYDSYVRTLAASGLSQDQLKAKVAQLKQEFIAQATQLGFSGQDIQTYAKHFDDLSTVIATVPRNVTVSANTNPALQALNEFLAKANAAKARVQVDAAASPSAWSSQGQAAGAAFANALNATLQQAAARFATKFPSTGPLLSGYVFSSARTGGSSINLNNLLDPFGTFGYASGGYTGPGGKYDIAGAVHKGEFVFDQTATNFFGTSFLNNLQQAGRSGNFASINSSGTGPLNEARLADMIGRAVAAYARDPSINASGISAAARMVNIADNAQGRA